MRKAASRARRKFASGLNLQSKCAIALTPEKADKEWGDACDAFECALFEILKRLRALVPDETQVLYRESARPEERSLTLPFLGRERELAALKDQFDRAIHGQGHLVLVSSEAGVGKTQLMQAFLDRCAGRAGWPALTLAARCYAPESGARPPARRPPPYSTPRASTRVASPKNTAVNPASTARSRAARERGPPVRATCRTSTP